MSWGVLFKGLGVQKDTQTPCWLRPCIYQNYLKCQKMHGYFDGVSLKTHHLVNSWMRTMINIGQLTTLLQIIFQVILYSNTVPKNDHGSRWHSSRHPLGVIWLTHSCLVIYLTKIVWTSHTFENDFGMKHEFVKYLKESCRWSSDEHFSFKYFPNIAFTRKIPPKLSGSFGCYRHE